QYNIRNFRIMSNLFYNALRVDLLYFHHFEGDNSTSKNLLWDDLEQISLIAGLNQNHF
ncbi:hypothetical protein SAMN05660493_03330, partial [Epilithonimonas bovis DSM 19482]